MTGIFGILSALMSGGATGLLGILLQRFFDLKSKQQDLELVRINNEHARLLAQMDVDKANRAAEAAEKVAEEQADAQVRSAELDAQARADEAAAREYVASIESDRATYLDPKSQARSKFARVMMTLVDSARGLIRPAMTLYLAVLSTFMYHWATDLASRDGFAMTAADAAELVKTIINTLLYLTTTCVVWWFGVRAPQKDRK